MSELSEWQELIDSLRSGSNDLQSPDFARLRAAISGDENLARAVERSHEFDEAVRQQLLEVEVPAGLAERLLAKLNESEKTVSSESQVRVRRLNWKLVAAALTAVAAAIVIALTIVPASDPTPIPTAGQLQQWALQWPDQIPSNWRVLDQKTPLPPSLALDRPRQWQVVSFPQLAAETECYEFVNGPSPVYLFVLPASSAMVQVGAAPQKPFETGGRCVAVWRRKDVVYVLVFDGTAQEYKSLIRRKAVA